MRSQTYMNVGSWVHIFVLFYTGLDKCVVVVSLRSMIWELRRQDIRCISPKKDRWHHSLRLGPSWQPSCWRNYLVLLKQFLVVLSEQIPSLVDGQELAYDKIHRHTCRLRIISIENEPNLGGRLLVWLLNKLLLLHSGTGFSFSQQFWAWEDLPFWCWHTKQKLVLKRMW